jgi:hypothetical protein
MGVFPGETPRNICLGDSQQQEKCSGESLIKSRRPEAHRGETQIPFGNDKQTGTSLTRGDT